MRDIPVFATESGVASLTLSQIPYTKKAYIRIQNSSCASDFLKECVGFCKMAGAENIYATGHSVCQEYPLSASVLRMQAQRENIGTTDACIFPVTEQTLEQWRSIYNDKVTGISNGAWMTIQESEKMLQQGTGYFVHSNGTLLGTGMVDGNEIRWIASVCPNAGVDVMQALCSAIMDDTVILEVADSNVKALNLYRKIGFIPVEILSVWHHVK